MKKRTLFLSINGALSALKEGRISSKDLDKGLFCVICTQAFFNQNDKKAVLLQSDPYFNEVFLALSMADDEGRCLWQERKKIQTQYGQLNFFLQKNDFHVSLTPAEFVPIKPKDVVKMVKSAGLGKYLNVIL